ncbi:MAG TPA: hypothetical protein VJ032_03980, partial [Thermoanaerobaculia bacterium]|nr:hypothetical protein [Thermoanaerobaculia bacterium]
MLTILLATALSTYQLPPKEIVEAFDAKPLPEAILSPSRKVLAFTQRRAQPTIAELAQPMLRLAGERINPKTFGLQRTRLIYAITLKKISGAPLSSAAGRGGPRPSTEINVTVPPNANMSWVKFSDDGSKLSFINTKGDDTELWIANVTTGKAKMAADHLNATTGDPCDWLHDNATLVCKFVPLGRRLAPSAPPVPSGPNVQENEGKTAQVATYEDMIKTAHDEELFAYYFTSQLDVVDGVVAGSQPAASRAKSPRTTPIGKPAIYNEVTPSPNGEYLLVTKIKRPFSHLLPMNGFAEDVEIL